MKYEAAKAVSDKIEVGRVAHYQSAARRALADADGELRRAVDRVYTVIPGDPTQAGFAAEFPTVVEVSWTGGDAYCVPRRGHCELQWWANPPILVLERYIEVRKMIDRWKCGELAELPAKMPWES